MDTLPSYLTAGGAVVTLAPSGLEGDEVTAACGGCRARQEISSDRPANRRGHAVARARKIAEEHAAECRAIPQPAPWPPGVVARATTYGGAHIDIARSNNIYVTYCTGCGTTERHPVTNDYPDQVYADAQAQNAAKAWALDHSTCPFEPRPTATA